ncbi:hypothetical protein GCM10007422_32080 [Pedobacter zeae]|uniref:Uncharacterized protein n=1 Tax=Pedobacter zeae TaxID=1737356 RepID=A0ABQ1Y4S3_9SPHI|nr:hypothetical protein GCM10007422_32080 [Pedobacter zeae]
MESAFWPKAKKPEVNNASAKNSFLSIILFCPKNKKLLVVKVNASRIIQKLFNNLNLSGLAYKKSGTINL